VGGIVWAKADAISHDCKRVYATGHENKWIFGTVLEVHKAKKSNKSKRATKYVKASYKVGEVTKEKLVWFGKSPPVWMGFLPKPFCPHH